MPGEMHVYLVNGHGVRSAAHIFRGNLIGFDQFCELASAFEDHTPNGQDTKIERETGFKDREELIAAYNALLAAYKALLATESQPA